jgi:hypothetical protein
LEHSADFTGRPFFCGRVIPAALPGVMVGIPTRDASTTYSGEAMKKQLSLIVLGLALCAGSAFAASHAGAPMKGASAPAKAAAPMAAASADKPMGKQQTKMADCNADAKEKSLKGDERKKFMSSCLSDKKTAQQNKMKTCNKDAGDKKLKGDERKKFMSSCLSA